MWQNTEWGSLPPRYQLFCLAFMGVYLSPCCPLSNPPVFRLLAGGVLPQQEILWSRGTEDFQGSTYLFQLVPFVFQRFIHVLGLEPCCWGSGGEERRC